MAAVFTKISGTWRQILVSSYPWKHVSHLNYTRLAEVGRLETPKLEGKYDTGQLFLHRIFGYRGITLFPWMARVYDRDIPNKKNAEGSEESSDGFNHVGREVKGKTHTYYQVLIDSRDCPYVRTQTEAVTFLGNQDNSRSLYAIPGLDYVAHEDILPYTSTEKQPLHHELFDKFLVCEPDKDPPFAAKDTLRAWQEKNHPWLELSDVHRETTEGVRITVIPFYMGCRVAQSSTVYWRTQTEAVTFLGNQDNSRSLYAIPGLDYVAHEDILPYTSTEKQPLHHELFDKFLVCEPDKDPPFSAKDTLRAWQEKNHPWLELSDVHRETTEGVRITVIPFYMGCRVAQSSTVYWWRYCIRLENLGDLAVQLRERHWRIFSLSGTLETVRGRGVVGQEPILSKSQPAFQYSSHVSLQAPSGHMWGTFRMEREDGFTFDCRIPPFSLESKQEQNPQPATV